MKRVVTFLILNTPIDLYTKRPIHHKKQINTPRDLYTKRPIHQEAYTPRIDTPIGGLIFSAKIAVFLFSETKKKYKF